ncbi:MAG: N-acetyltransferase [Ruminococcaceae bacterium]|nr:N-acetyltransferase [Oscillospiraceae bacterium]
MLIRRVYEKDAEKLLAIYAPYVEKTAISFEYEVPSAEEFRNRIKSTSEKYPYLVAEVDGEIVGYTYAGTFKPRQAYSWAVEVSLYVSKAHQGKGIGSALYEELEKLLRAMNITNMNACITHAETPDEYLSNKSESFHEKAGFTKVAHFHKVGYKFQRHYDMIWMEKIISEHKGEVRHIAEIMEEYGY